MKRVEIKKAFICLMVLMASGLGVLAQPQFLPNEDPKPANKKWVKVESLSDEFNGSALDENKWQNTDTRWIGRPPGLFTKGSVSMANGHLRMTSSTLPKPEIHKNERFLYACSYVRSRDRGQVGWYYESRFKGSKTFMSSTFWLINRSNEFSGCDRRATELDIQEGIGISTKNWDRRTEVMASATHSRNPACNSTPTGTVKVPAENRAPLGGKSYADFHTFGAWWKSPKEILFYLDGKYVRKLVPKADFNLPMYLMMVTETYDWNPPAANKDGMNGSWAERTALYDWTRVWRLEDDDTNNNTPYVDMRKGNTNFAMDGGNGGANHRNLYLWSYNPATPNQQWEEISKGNGYYAYKKRGTNFCLDGGRGGQSGQNVILYTCGPNNQNQHWKKVNLGEDKYRLEKRNAPGFSIDGGEEGTNRQIITLSPSNDADINQQWLFGPVSNAPLRIISPQKSNSGILVYPNPVSDEELIMDLSQFTKKATVKVFDMNGKLIYETQSKPGLLKVDTGNFKKGMYMLTVSEGGMAPKTTKLMVE